MAVGIVAVLAVSAGVFLVLRREPSSQDRVHSVIRSLERYWDRADSDLGFVYRHVSADRITIGDEGVRCDGKVISKKDVSNNAMVLQDCREGIAVAYDPKYATVSQARIEGVFSHEWGHVIQAEASQLDISLDDQGLPIDAELQADCFSGAWARHAAESSLKALQADAAESGDDRGTAVDDPQAHGLAGERVVAFDVGWKRGPRGCVDQLLDALPG